MIATLLDRLEQVLREELADLQSGNSAKLRDHTTKKTQLLLELAAAEKTEREKGFSPELARRITSVRELLAANQAVLSTHLEAARQVTAIVVDAMRKAESDGTYSPVTRRTYFK